MPRLLLLLLALALAGCALPKVDPAREAQTDAIYKMVRAGDTASLRQISTPALSQNATDTSLRQMWTHMYRSEPTSARTVAWTLNVVNGDAAYRVARLYTHREGDVQLSVTMVRRADGPWHADAIHLMRVTPEAVKAHDAAVEASRFTLLGKSFHHYVVLVAALASATICLGSAIVAGIRRRWLWMIGCLFGVGQLTVNWATGAVFFQPLYFALLGAGFLKGLGATDPWLISAALPLPALFFWGLGKGRPKPRKQQPKTNTSVF